MNPRAHGRTVYRTKDPERVSWYQERPTASPGMIESAELGPGARILDVGGGATHLVDHLLDAGYRQVGVLDVAAEALARPRARLGDRAPEVEGFESDVLPFASPHPWDLWTVLHPPVQIERDGSGSAVGSSTSCCTP